ncbi:MAG TPA: hypothetical protein PLV03_02325 [Clostridiales bacterium]|nr:hypothetical protein [Clostridiales bacterium]
MNTAEIIISVIGVILALATFLIGRLSASNTAGREIGGITKDITYIKDSVDRLSGQLSADVKRLEGRIDEQTKQISCLATETTKAMTSAASAHHRIDEIRNK